MADKEPKIDKRRTPEFREHLRAIGRQKGQPRPEGAGRKKEIKIADYVKGLMSDKAEEAVETIHHLMKNAEKESVRLDAAKAFIAPFVGKAPKQIQIEANLGAAELLRLATMEQDSQMIDITPDEVEDDEE